MASDLHPPSKQSTSEFWRAYFAKFRRQVEDHEPSETGPAPLGETSARETPVRSASSLQRPAPRTQR